MDEPIADAGQIQSEIDALRRKVMARHVETDAWDTDDWQPSGAAVDLMIATLAGALVGALATLAVMGIALHWF